MANSNPVRAQYAYLGTLQCAGIRTIGGETFIAREGSTAPVPVDDPAAVLWIQQRAINHAQRNVQRAAKAAGRTYEVDLDNPIITAELVAEIARDRKAVRRTTEDMIVHMLGGESPANRAYAQAQIQALNEFYLPAAATKAA